ncbi:efflux transporter outer membrane subunit [Caballeronia mineralivorans]|uniref:efflux transporter outer membrane subunit n=1 Tax=Caballeronia mineralivorans TaxID=2010198 RepID=UPI0023F214CD|nr:efflux transporter outer membrane subunit [Caballeronia mineralivorans]MDB5780513.1 transporter [Caballeronia mineralivorans]
MPFTRIPVFPRKCAIVLVLALAGCAVGPNYKRPEAAIPAAYKEAPEGWKVAQPADRVDRGNWWTIYHDPQLNDLETRLNASNQTVAQFAAVYRQARALVAEARASYFPTLGVTGAGTRAGASGRTGGSSVSNNFDLGLNASWEPDLWGTVSRTVGAQKAGEQSAAADLANARLSAQGTLAQTYFQLRSLDAQQRLLDDTVAAYQRTLQLTQNQYAQGTAARSDVIQAQTQLLSAQAAAIDNGVARAQFEHAIAALVGEPASTFSIAASPLDATPPEVPLEMPSAILERRPDVASAERKAAAANEQIGVTIAAFFPTLTFSASGGFQNSVLSQLLSAPSRFWTLGPSLAANIFDGGLRIAQTEAARAAYDSAVATYRQTILSAFQDVEDNLASQRILANEVVVQEQAVASAQQALAIVTNQYKSGTVGFINVLTAQATAFTAEQKLASIAGQRMVSSVGLIKSLGGGWDTAQIDQETGSAAAPVPASGVVLKGPSAALNPARGSSTVAATNGGAAKE